LLYLQDICALSIMSVSVAYTPYVQTSSETVPILKRAPTSTKIYHSICHEYMEHEGPVVFLAQRSTLHKIGGCIQKYPD